ncbi:MAG: RNA pseudouridine synthase [Bacteroidia bacterium]
MSGNPINNIPPQAEKHSLHARVLYSDNHLIAVNKLPGEIVQGDKTGDMPLSELVAAYLKVLMNKPGDAFVGVIHRIDRPVSGVVLFARTGKGLSRLNEQFRDRKISKTYYALVEGNVSQPEGKLIHFLVKNEARNTSRAVSETTAGALRSELSFRVVQHFDRYTLLEVNPITGRHHQIRVQLSAAGWIIKGDVKYGAKRANRDKSICLHARSLRFTKATGDETVQVEAPLPGTADWLGLDF